MGDLAPRPLPEAVARTTCDGCTAEIVWAMTVAGPNGRGGKLMPLDPVENLGGNVAVTAPHRGRLLARVLTKGERFDRPHEYAGMPHFATCWARAKPAIPAELLDGLDSRQQRRVRRRHGRGRR